MANPARKNSIVKIIAWITYALFLLVTIVTMVLGAVTFFSTITLYATILLLGISFLVLLRKRGVVKGRFQNLQLIVISTVITLCLADLTLRYIVKPQAYLDYNERNGKLLYTSGALRQKFRWINKYFIPKNSFGWIRVNQPGTTKQLSKAEFSYQHKFNSEGLRTDEVSVAKKKNEIRILTLGDSFTEGVGAPQDSTWPRLLEQSLASISGDTTYTVINAGVSGSDPYFESYLLKYSMLKYKPDIVTVSINASDIDDVIERGGYERFLADSTFKIKDSPWWEFFYGSSMIYRMVIRNVFHYNLNLKHENEDLSEKALAVQKLMEPVEQFYQLSLENNFKLVIIFHPTLWELQSETFALTPLVSRSKQNKNITVVDLNDRYHKYFTSNNLDPKNYYWATDMHHNSRGYLLWQQIVFQSLVESNNFINR